MSTPAQAVQPEKSGPFHNLALLYKANADPLRLEILRLLAKDSYGVMEFCSILSIKQSSMSHHLKVLAMAGMVDSRREGNSIFYHRAPRAKFPENQLAQENIFRNLDTVQIPQEIKNNIANVQRVRASSSQRFFAENASKFKEQQNLIASYDQYAKHVRELLVGTVGDRDNTALEIGPGEGTFLEELSPLFREITALDNSREMLRKTAEFVTCRQLSNVLLLEGDTYLALRKNLRVDCAICNMVLHHVASPAELFGHVFEFLGPKGNFFVTDLCSHDQSWVKEACGDLWLGFEPGDITRWAKAVHFHEGNSIHLALRNGFRIQVRHFYKP
jgi:DNA-binding transcriptional ArsR family regulator